MKKMRYSLAAGIIAAIVLAAAGCSGSEAESASETTQQETAQQTTAQASETEAAEDVKEEVEAEYIFKYTHASPAQGFQQDGAIHLGEMLKEYSGGRIIQETYPAGQLAEKQASLEGLQFGTIEITALSLSDLSQFDNIWDVFALPYLFDSADQAVKIMSDPQIKEITDASAGDAGFRVLAWVNVGERNIMNSKQRSMLKGMAMNIDPIFQIGKGGLTPEITEAVSDALEKRELVKINILKNCDDDRNMLAEALAGRTGSEVVQVIGKKIVLFRYQKDPKKRKIELSGKKDV